MEAPSVIGMGIAFLAIGGIWSLLSKYKPDLSMFKKYSREQFYRNQGAMVTIAAVGVMLIIMGAMELLK